MAAPFVDFAQWLERTSRDTAELITLRTSQGVMPYTADEFRQFVSLVWMHLRLIESHYTTKGQ